MATNLVTNHHTKGIRDLYRSYKDRRGKAGHKDSIDYNKYRTFLIAFFQEMYKAIITEDFIWTTPVGMFYVNAVKTTETGNYALDKKQSKLRDKRIYNFNLHTSGYAYKFKWSRQGVRFMKNARFYEFKLTGTHVNVDDYGRQGMKNLIMDIANDPKRSLIIPKNIR